MKAKTLLRTLALFCLFIGSTTDANAYDFMANGIYYNINGDQVYVTYQMNSSTYPYSSNYSGDITIPEKVIYNGKTYTVTAIGDHAFYNCYNVTSITMPNTIKRIEDSAFNKCRNMTSITMGNAIDSVGIAFNGCSGLRSICISDLAAWCKIEFKSNPLSQAQHLYLNGIEIQGDIEIPSSVNYIGESVFSGWNGLTSITIPNSVKSIHRSAFSDCTSLSSANIPNSVLTIGDYAFRNCYSLASLSIGNSVTTIGDLAFENCSGLSNVIIPNSVTSIGKQAFANCLGLTSVDIGKSVITIGENAFRACESIKRVNISDLAAWCMIEFNGYAYANPLYYARNLYLNGSLVTDIVVPNSVTNIGDYAFINCESLKSISIPNSVISIGVYSFNKCENLRSVIMGSSVKTIENLAFSHCVNLSDLIIGESVETIALGAFTDCRSIRELAIPNSVLYIEKGAFSSCSSLQTIVFGNSIEIIGQEAFHYCRELSDVLIPNSVIELGYKSFASTGIKSVRIGKSVTNIGEYAFSSCPYLSNISVDDLNTKYDSRNNCNAIIETSSNTLVVGCKNTVIPNTILIIGASAFYGCSGLTRITIPLSVHRIVEDAFRGCNLSNVICENNTPPTIQYSYAFDNAAYDNAILSVPANALNTYMNTNYWSLFKHFKEGTDPVDISINSPEIGPTSFVINVDKGYTNITETYLLFDGSTYHQSYVTGLQPESQHNTSYVIETASGNIYSPRIFTTPALSMTAKAADMVTNRDARLMAETNMADIETSCGFEWRRYDAPEEMPSAKVYCPVYGGVMAGTLKNMSENVYYKYRPFYKSSAGNEYYGDWVAFITADAGVEFDPVVYTYNSPAVTQTEATLQGVALRGSEEITEQGFEYWKTSNNKTLTAANEVIKVTAKGERMSKTVEGLKAGTKYTFRAYVIAGGETTYGEEVQFVTRPSSMDVNLDGEVNIADVNKVIEFILSGNANTVGDVNNDGEVNIADINAIIKAILSN